MQKTTVITGGAGGMGFATAKLVGKSHHLVISDVRRDRLQSAAAELEKLGISCEPVVCDIADRASVDALVKRAADAGTLAAVIHTAGISPQMGDPQTIIKVNALGTVHVTDACYEVATEGFALVNVASMAAHMAPELLMPKRAYRYAQTDPELFLKKMLVLPRMMPKDLYRTGMAYATSKHFVVWLSRTSAGKFGAKGARILSVSPGSFDTEMGRLEEKSGSAAMLKTAALKRFGRPEEIAELLAFCASDRAGYLTGVDILCDGGVIAGRR